MVYPERRHCGKGALRFKGNGVGCGMEFRSYFLTLRYLCCMILLLAVGCPKETAPVKAPTAVSKAQKKQKPPKKKKRTRKQTLAEAEKANDKYPCQEFRCEEAYRTFAVRHQAHQRPVGVKAVEDWRIKYKKKKMPKAQGIKGAALREAIIDKMNIGFLLEDLHLHREVRVVHEQKKDGLRETIIEIIDPHVGRFDALLLTPSKARASASAVLGLHGHGDSPETMARKYLGRRLAQHGHHVALPRVRAHDCLRNVNVENMVAIDLWAHGFSLMGLHVYEALVAQKVAQSHWGFEDMKWGVLGHSGGSSLANLLPRVNDGFSAKAVDYFVSFNNRCGPKRIHCETFGPLFPLANDINDDKTLSIPTLSLPYGYKKRSKEVLPFFTKHLAN